MVLVLLHGRMWSFLSCSWIFPCVSDPPNWGFPHTLHLSGEKLQQEGSRGQQPQVDADPSVHGQGVTLGAVTPPGQWTAQNEALKSKNVIWSNIFKGKSRAGAYQVPAVSCGDGMSLYSSSWSLFSPLL